MIFALLTIILSSSVLSVYAEPDTIFIDTGFEDEPSPQQCFWDGYAPSGFGGDIGDGEFTDPDVAVMWVIDSDDDPYLGRLPPIFIDGSKCVWGKVKPDPVWSTECFLMNVIVDQTQALYISWYQAFNPIPTGSDWLPIFWDFVRKVRVSDGQVVQYTVPVVKATLSNSQVSISASSDSNLGLSGASTTSYPLEALQWYNFEFWHLLDEIVGEITLKINNVTVFDFVGDTVAKTLDPNYVYTAIHGFEVGIQFPALTSSTNYTYWLDKIVVGDYIIPEFSLELILLILVLTTSVIIIVRKRKTH